MPIVTVVAHFKPPLPMEEELTIEVGGIPSDERHHFQEFQGTWIGQHENGKLLEILMIHRSPSSQLRQLFNWDYGNFSLLFVNPVLEVLDKLGYKVMSSHGGSNPQSGKMNQVFIFQK